MQGLVNLIGNVTVLLIAAMLALPVSAAEDNSGQALVTRFWQANGAEESATARAALLAATTDINTLYRWLKSGPAYTADAGEDRHEGARAAADGTLFRFVFIVPASYDPARSYPVEFMLHGGVSGPPWDAGGAWWRRGYDAYRNLEQITVMPASWNGHFWWQDSQAENLPAILRLIKQSYNVDENRVYLSGVSDGGTGAYFFAFKQPTEWAAFLPYIGHPGVLRNSQSGGGHALYFENLMNNALFIVNGENDPLYPAASMSPFIDILKEAKINHEFTVIADGGHNTSWMPDELPRINAFKEANVRDPLPDNLIWVADSAQRYNRNAWIRVDELAVSGRPGLLRVERVGNQFTVTAERVAEFSLLLNPEEVNFNELITVSVNGAMLFNGQVLQDANTLLNHAANALDRSQLFTAELRLQVPE